MSNVYKFRFRTGTLEVELESDDKAFVEGKFAQLMELGGGKNSFVEETPSYYSDASSSEADDPSKTLIGKAIEHQPMPAKSAPIDEALEKTRKGKRQRIKAVVSKKEDAKLQKAGKAPRGKKTKAPKKESAAPAEIKSTDLNTDAIARLVKTSPHFSRIEDKVLWKANQLNRILMSFYFAKKVHPDKELTTGDLEAITYALNVGIKSTNISSQLKKHEDLFEPKGERKRGAVVRYTFTPAGEKKFEELLTTP
jgi:hypothetical protein